MPQTPNHENGGRVQRARPPLRARDLRARGGMKLRTSYANHRYGKNCVRAGDCAQRQIRFTKPPRRANMRLPRGGFRRSGSARLGRSQKDGLPFAAGKQALAVQGHQLAHREGQPGCCPSLIGKREWTIKRATLLCLRAYRSSAQASPGSRVILFWVGSLLRWVQPLLSA